MVKEKIVSTRTIEQKIYLIRGQKVMPDKDLAQLYGIETKVLKQAVKRNINQAIPCRFYVCAYKT